MPSRADRGAGQRYLLYARDGVGIGHLVRTCTLARGLRRRLPDAEVVIASGSPSLGRFAPPGCLTLPLPPLLAPLDHAEEDEPRRQHRRLHRHWRRALLWATAKEFSPHVVLVDHSPAGKKDELVEPLEYLAARGSSLVLGYRRIAEDADSIRDKLGSATSRSLLESAYRQVLVYAPGWVREQLGEIAPLPIFQVYTGFVCRTCRLTQQQARVRLDLPRKGRIVACCLGGGRGAWPLAERILTAWGRRPRQGWLVLFCGPHLEVPRRVGGSSVRLIRHSIAFPVGIVAADGVISTAGYNSMLEVLRHGRPLWAIPNQEAEREQFLSAGMLEEMGFAGRLLQESTLEVKLDQAFAAILEGVTRVPCVPAAWFQGRRNAVEILAELGEQAVQMEGRCNRPSAS